MSSRNIVLSALALAAVVGAWQVGQHKAPTTEISSAEFLPGLLDQINKTTTLQIKTKDGEIVIARKGDGWIAQSLDNYPAKSDAVKQALVELASLKIVEAKTTKADKYAQIGVDDVSGPTAKGHLVTAIDAENKRIVSVIIGNEHATKSAGASRHYVRKAGDAGAYLVDGELSISDKANDWLDTSVVDLPVERVHQVTVVPQADTPITVSKASPEVQLYDLTNVPDGFEVKARATVSSIGGILLDARFDKVIAASKLAGLTPTAVATVETFDGLTATIERYSFNSAAYLTFKFEHTPDTAVTLPAVKTDAAKPAEGSPPVANTAPLKKPDDVAKEATALNAKVNGWAYGLPEYKSRLLEKKFSDLIAKKAPPAAKGAPAENK